MAILQDPVMQSILQQAKSDPAALQDHMKNADIRSKVSLATFVLPPYSANVSGTSRSKNWLRLESSEHVSISSQESITGHNRYIWRWGKIR